MKPPAPDRYNGRPVYYGAGQYVTQTDDDWYVFAFDGETGGVLDCEDGPMSYRKANFEAMWKNRQLEQQKEQPREHA